MNVEITKELIKGFEDSTGLQFEMTENTPNVCFATENKNLRDDFKLIFNLQDLKHYLMADSHNLHPNSDHFWEVIKKSKSK